MNADHELGNTRAYLRRCYDCDILVRALRDLEQQCRDVENEQLVNGLIPLSTGSEGWFEKDQQYLAQLREVEHRRNCALEALLRHQRLEHS